MSSKAGVPKCQFNSATIISFFLIYINNLSDNLESNIKLFSFGTSMFSVVSEPVTTTVTLNKDLDNVDLQGNQWKMPFNPDPSKQGQEVIFHVS